MAGVAGIAEDGSTGCETNPGAADAGAGAGTPCPITVARQSSQYNTSRTGREHAEHIGLPQFLQYPVASTSVWTAHFIEFSLPSTYCELIAHEQSELTACDQSELAARDKAEFAAEEGNFLGQHLEL
jgi:hypothetical protein